MENPMTTQSGETLSLSAGAGPVADEHLPEASFLTGRS
jgi:hypothetical protein